jgi:hypothetical protein
MLVKQEYFFVSMARGVDKRGKETEMAGFAVSGSFQGFTR